ncbi:MAG: gamma-glutamyl-gamma-aminobutyrate hydrolase family protein, partial [Erysipelotrichaceae bacterium]|nr:gamma-glutamyl-gamma-aminobutyrate hydrolase family protein [Erysipelotrichaceae bacterium]
IPRHRTGTREDAHHFAVNIAGSPFAKIYGQNCMVNSSHHQAVKKVAEGFDVLQVSTDGYIEGMIHRSLPIIAVQYHPERMTLDYLQDDVADGKLLFEEFFSLIK